MAYLNLPKCLLQAQTHLTDFKKNRAMKPDLPKSFVPGYVKLHESGVLKNRGEILWAIMENCRLCPRECDKKRTEGEKGICQASDQLVISSHHAHYGEEEPLVGTGGSGTIFFSHCSLRCVFCINWEISIGGQGFKSSIRQLANMMLDLQERGCHNINVVTPTHYAPHIVLALDIAAGKGLRLPLVYNTCGWERIDILQLLDGIVDIYLPDFKYFDPKMAHKYSEEADVYPERTKAALLEMNRQVGTAHSAPDGHMYRGLMIRHLVMPNNVSGTKEVIDWIANNLPKDTYLNLMAQYRPMHKAYKYPEIARSITVAEYRAAIQYAVRAGLTNLEIQGC